MVVQAVIFPDIELWFTGYLRGALEARSEPYAAGVKVSNAVPSTMPDRLVAFRRDGGGQTSRTLEAARLTVRVWAKTEREVTDLARLCSALLRAAPDGAPVCRVSDLSGPSPIADPSGKPARIFTIEAVTRGVDL